MSAQRRPGPRVVEIIAACLLIASTSSLRADDWPQWRGNGRLAVWNETGLVDRFPETGLKITWRVPVNAGYSGPAVAGGRVFVTDARRTSGSRVVERVIVLDERSGKTVWSKEWDANYSGLEMTFALGPRATPTVDGDLVYVLGAMGNLFALNVKDGSVAWQKNFVDDFDAGNGDAELDGLNHRVRGAGHRLERAHSGAHRLWSAVEPECEFGDHAQRAFGADEQPREVIAGRRLARPAAGPDDLPVGEDHRQPQHVVAHGAVANRGGA